jgi:hypothetical protein
MMRIAVPLLLAAGLIALVSVKALTPVQLTAAEIVARNVAARGGLEAWRRVKTMAWAGRIESVRSGAPPKLPFLLEMQRPNKTHFEIAAVNGRSLRVFDGHEGWKLHPNDSGQPDLQPYSPDEIKLAAEGQGFDGPLLDYQAKGVAITLAGSEDIEGHKAYRLDVTLPSGAHNSVWVDAHSYLDVQTARESRNAAGATATVISINRDFRNVHGLMIPFTIETGIGATLVPDRMIIERIAFDPQLGKEVFARPEIAGKRNVISVRAMPEETAAYGSSVHTSAPGNATAEAGASGTAQ